MPRPGVLILALMAALGAWFVTSQGGPGVLTRGVQTWRGSSPENTPDAKPANSHTIRIASWDLDGFGAEELKQPEIMEIALRILRQFDVIALQRVTSPEAFILPSLVDQVNLQGLHYDFVIGPRTGDEGSQQQIAILFNTDRVEVDRLRMYSVADPDDLMLHEPLVASFRCRELLPQQAFTFSLVNVFIDESETEVERNFLPQIYQAVTQDGRREDDIIMAGNFQASAESLTELLGGTSMRTVVVELPTGLGTLEKTDNVVLSVAATTEFTGRAGVLDFLREFNLSLEQARKLTTHLPVWAEFTLQEGGVPGRVADQRLNSGSLSSTLQR